MASAETNNEAQEIPAPESQALGADAEVKKETPGAAVPGPRQSTAAARQASAAARRSHLAQVRAAARSRLASIQQHRRDLSKALGNIHTGLVAYRSQIREQLRHISAEANKSRQQQNKASAAEKPAADNANATDQGRAAAAGGKTT